MTDPTSAGSPEFESPTKEIVELWHYYEEIAMHFNDLIMRWRLQAIGGLAALVTVGGFVVGDVADEASRYRGMLLLSFTFLCAWYGVAYIDLNYYRRLLDGAVAGILELEKKIPQIKLSTKIDEFAKDGASRAPRFFYKAGAVTLVAIMVWALWKLR